MFDKLSMQVHANIVTKLPLCVDHSRGAPVQALQGAKGKRPEKAEGKGPQGPKKTF